MKLSYIRLLATQKDWESIIKECNDLSNNLGDEK